MLCFILSVPIKCKDLFALWIGRRFEIILNIICFWNALINKPLSEVVGKRCRPWRILRQSQSTDSDHPEILRQSQSTDSDHPEIRRSRKINRSRPS